LGDLGLLVAGWMIERGARHLILVSRRECGAEDEAKIRELQEMGGRPKVVRADVSNPGLLAAVIAGIDPSLPLKGVIHAAGVLDDGLLLQQDRTRFDGVLASKMMGAWHLHRLTLHLPLDFFVLFASVAGVFGSTGQANHSAANTFLDGLAHHRRALGLPALSIDWGIWSQLGAAARRRADAQARMKAMGSILPRRGIEALEKLFDGAFPRGPAQVAVVPIEWQHFQEQVETTPFLADFNRATEGVRPTIDAALLKRIQESPVSERRALLEEHLSAQVAQVLGWGPDRSVDTKQGFFNSGMDSLTSLELRNLIQRSLGCSLPATVAFDYPNIEALVGYLVEEVPALRVGSDAPSAEPSPRRPAPEKREESSTAPSALPTSDVRELLDQRLMAIEGLLEEPFEKARP
jgi:acyl carrier protein